MRATETVAEARRVMEVCNACRYCEGFCAVFPAMELKRDFSNGDLGYLANLCHGCQGCYYACQYAPPHEWGINVPAAFAELRRETYVEYAWPPALARAFQRNGLVVSLAIAVCLILVLGLAVLLRPGAVLFGARPAVPGSFYAVIPLWAMQIVALGSAGFTLLALFRGGANFWRDAGPARVGPLAVLRALWDVLSLRNLGGGGHGCNDRDEGFSMTRRWLHHAMFYGFLLCFAATTTGFVYEELLGLSAPYPLTSLPVVLGTLGGVGLLIGCIGLLAMKFVRDPIVSPASLLGADVAILVLLALAALSGLVLLVVRSTDAMGLTLATHLGLILALFVTIPYSRMVHGLYRGLALVRNAVERAP